MELTGRRMTWICSYVLLQILFFSSYATSRSIVKTLPGFDGDLPFKLETGYVGMGEIYNYFTLLLSLKENLQVIRS
uniref:Uncharacterized protein n=1 Tax=Quercus lobata TaxID=97700 RepID=A0A7N2KMK9_QUELO